PARRRHGSRYVRRARRHGGRARAERGADRRRTGPAWRLAAGPGPGVRPIRTARGADARGAGAGRAEPDTGRATDRGAARRAGARRAEPDTGRATDRGAARRAGARRARARRLAARGTAAVTRPAAAA